MKEIKDIVAQNLTQLRIDNKLTQSELAIKVNYTDKSVSKWEHGEAMPPIDVLKQLADIYRVTLDYLVTENPTEEYGKLYKDKQNSKNKAIITLLSASAIWVIATTLFVYVHIFSQQIVWQLFIYAIPLSSVVLLIFNCIWGKRIFTFILISIILWTTLLSVYILLIKYNCWALFIIGIPFQLSTILWSQLKKSTKK